MGYICFVTEIARGLKLYGAGQDLLKDTFTGTVKGMGSVLLRWSLRRGRVSR